MVETDTLMIVLPMGNILLPNKNIRENSYVWLKKAKNNINYMELQL